MPLRRRSSTEPRLGMAGIRLRGMMSGGGKLAKGELRGVVAWSGCAGQWSIRSEEGYNEATEEEGEEAEEIMYI